MINREPKDIQKIFREGTLIDEAMNAAVRDAVQLHKEKGLPMVVCRDGKIIWITPEEAEQSLASNARKPPAC
jgi:imidazolonepropionase-like amidohydrolase